MQYISFYMFLQLFNFDLVLLKTLKNNEELFVYKIVRTSVSDGMVYVNLRQNHV